MTVPYIVTIDGKRLCVPSRASMDVATLRDVAVNHARTPMFGGHTDDVYYVGHHCIAAQVIAGILGESPVVQLYTLLHEAEVVAYGDVPGPMKIDAQRIEELSTRYQFLDSLGLPPPTTEQWARVEFCDKIEQAASASWLGFRETVHNRIWEATDTKTREMAVRVTRDTYKSYPPAECTYRYCPLVEDFQGIARSLLRTLGLPSGKA